MPVAVSADIGPIAIQWAPPQPTISLTFDPNFSRQANMQRLSNWLQTHGYVHAPLRCARTALLFPRRLPPHSTRTPLTGFRRDDKTREKWIFPQLPKHRDSHTTHNVHPNMIYVARSRIGYLLEISRPSPPRGGTHHTVPASWAFEVRESRSVNDTVYTTRPHDFSWARD